MVHDLMSHLVSWIYLHPNWAGLALFLLSATESMTAIGCFIPGTIVMTAVGIFIGAGLLPYWPMVAWAVCGSVISDGLNFTLGYYLKDNLGRTWPFKTRPHWLSKGQQFFEKHGGKSIFFARFLGPFRAFAPIIAGAMRMPASKFYLMDTISAIVWGTTYLLPGVLLGKASLELSPDISEHLFRLVFVTLIIVIIALWGIRLLVLHINEVVKNALSCLWSSMKESPSFTFICHIFRHHNSDHPRGQLGTLFVLLLVLLAFLCLMSLVYTNHPVLTKYNDQLYHWIETWRMHWLDNLMLLTTILGEKEVIGVSFIAVLAWLCFYKNWRAAIFWIGAFFLGAGGAYVLKDLIHVHRPSLSFEAIDGLSFPSGHVVIATLFYGGFAYLAAGCHAIKSRWTGYVIAIILIAAVMCSRVFLGVHWMSDILGSVLFAWLCLLFMALFYQRHPSQNIQALKILPFLIVLQIVVSWAYVHYNYSKLINAYFPASTMQTINKNSWWQTGGSTVAMTATNRMGTSKELLTIQWAGKQEDIMTMLQAHGWHSALEAHNWVLEIQHPEEKTAKINLHLKIRFFEDKKPKLIFYKSLNSPHDFMVLQLWQTDMRLEPSALGLFAGTLSFNQDIENHESAMAMSHATLTTEFLQTLDHKVATRMLATQPGHPPVILIQPVS